MTDHQVLRAFAVDESTLHFFDPCEECGGTIYAFEVRRIIATKVLELAAEELEVGLQLLG